MFTKEISALIMVDLEHFDKSFCQVGLVCGATWEYIIFMYDCSSKNVHVGKRCICIATVLTTPSLDNTDSRQKSVQITVHSFITKNKTEIECIK